jgi:phosphate starvation-inducible protein PhoH
VKTSKILTLILSKLDLPKFAKTGLINSVSIIKGIEEFYG